MSDIPFDIIAFDLDGTLADTAPDLAAALNHTLEALGRPAVPPESVYKLVERCFDAVERSRTRADVRLIVAEE